MNNLIYKNGHSLPILNNFKASTLKSIFIILFLFSFQNLFSQTVAPPRDSYITIENNIGTVVVSIEDSTNVNEIEVDLGTKNNSDDLFSNSFTFDQSSGLSTGLSYSRNGLNVFLGVGTLDFPPAFNVRVRIKDNNGNWSSYLSYISN